MQYLVRHTTRYKYAQRVTHCYNLANVIPRNTDHQRCLNHHFTVAPQPAITRKRKDYFGNDAYHFEIQKAHKELIITAESSIQIDARDSELDLGASYGEALDFLAKNLTAETIEARDFLLDSPMVKASEELADYARPSFEVGRSLKSSVSELTSRIFNDFTFDPGFTAIATPLTEVLKHRRGVCQDFAHLQVGCLRSMGIPAKYVSGYIETLPKPGEKKLQGADATHAWIAFYCPGEGWMEFDPTNNTSAKQQHIVTALGRDYYDVTPVKGVIFGGGAKPVLTVSVDVRRVPETGS